ncbi:MAG TPA: hypothetical protein VGI00_21080 [Streptosporangiaceae bacterium]|jgi:hypothetical protein
MGRHGQRRGTKPAVAAVSPALVATCLAAALAGCSASSPAARPASSGTGHPAAAASPTVHPTPAHPTRPAHPTQAAAITIAGSHPVPPNGSQDTQAQTPATSCDRTTLATDQALGGKIAAGFVSASLPVSADLLTHFLQGTGTGVDYRAGSVISKQALASAAFRAVDSEVQLAILGQLKAGRTQVRLAAAQLPLVSFEASGGDLYWGFRGTQGLSVTGSVVHAADGRYDGTLSYVIRDSYGFPASDTLAGFGAPMRYLQTVCGAPQHPGGAHWFPDTITVTVPFTHPA